MEFEKIGRVCRILVRNEIRLDRKVALKGKERLNKTCNGALLYNFVSFVKQAGGRTSPIAPFMSSP